MFSIVDFIEPTAQGLFFGITFYFGMGGHKNLSKHSKWNEFMSKFGWSGWQNWKLQNQMMKVVIKLDWLTNRHWWLNSCFHNWITNKMILWSNWAWPLRKQYCKFYLLNIPKYIMNFLYILTYKGIWTPQLNVWQQVKSARFIQNKLDCQFFHAWLCNVCKNKVIIPF